MHELVGALRSYAWGSRTALAELCGRPVPSAHPEAELWFGAHPADPAYVTLAEGTTKSLLDLVAADPERELGAAGAQFGDKLPFLLKILAAEEPLSLQAHPSAEQARAGFERENRAGVPLDSPMRNYRDDNHKPELVVALDRFEALAGFRAPERTVELFRALAVPELEQYADLLAAQPDSAGLRTLFTTWITLPQPVLATLLPAVLDGCVRYLSGKGKRPFVAEARTALELAEVYPGDAGVLAALLLNRLTLEPGQALFLDAGNLHAYLRGVGVEIMANSDNVLRGGLTPKHVDVPELLRILDFEPIELPVVLPEPGGDGSVHYRTPAPEFALRRFDLVEGAGQVPLTDAGPGIVLCTAGTVLLRHGDDELTVGRGSAAWISAADSDIRARAVDGPAQVFCACVGGGA
ncbi:mannose-6-phosphate isomerase, class I [Nocardia farcinica]|uniref:mannose-6-phosphate isomerase n=1 Tax=Nocardia farcinica TaxID=37329 RepID=A0A449GIA9_NOCFR|nr:MULTISPECIES: mannose-6-phosphate isomerase, class I [Nocardia]MBA4854935.1 mannose-6-phosphate isomerase, class I [Nocardia farcinica]MBC9814902.1 mannose-6-phosphate isomerase, class I [Nocardia farcinica]MBF6070483.1 mannose-6-phosphate isomerase, class I [Nocardia farcinica]MBF6143409.1 mannose-6-phosphate isomerase, class I [Nocardia farcinica]MBF6189298.1 mannose-6-phosphate isomerase, class I [Nocardia farcinica]